MMNVCLLVWMCVQHACFVGFDGCSIFDGAPTTTCQADKLAGSARDDGTVETQKRQKFSRIRAYEMEMITFVISHVCVCVCMCKYVCTSV